MYEAKLNGNSIIFYILLEHQSSVDYRMPYRLVLYEAEILRYCYNNTDPKKRDTKDFKFPVIFPLVLYTGSGEWTVPLQVRDMFENPEIFGDYVLGFKYLLLDAKGYNDDDLKKFSSKLLAIIFLLEKSKIDIEFYSNIRNNLDDIKDFDTEEKRILNLCIKIMDIAYGYNKSEDIKRLIEGNNIMEVGSMLCDVIENAKYKKERLIEEGRQEGERVGELRGRQEGWQEERIEMAKSLLLDGLPIEAIVKWTKLSKAQIESIKLD